MIERYASRWSIEVAIEDARHVFGAGQARNRTVRAVERTVPFQLACQAITTCWYATAGHDPADDQGPALDRRHGRQATLRPPPGLGGRSGITAKAELSRTILFLHISHDISFR